MRKTVLAVLCVLWALVQIATITFLSLEALQVVALHLGFALAVTVMGFPLKTAKLSNSVKLWSDMALAAFSVAFMVYFIGEYDRISNHMMFISDFTLADMVVGGFVMLLTIEATRRVLGLPLSILVVISLVYMLVGPHIPGVLNSKPISVKEIVEFNFFTTSGLFGVALQASATYVYIFVLFAAILEVSGLGPKFMDIILSISGKSRGGPAKVAVVSSGLFGMITGSPSSNVAFTGSFTIPLMKKVGFKPSFAGAVESVASSAGMIVPPLLGTAVFLMVQFTRADMSTIIFAAVLPALLYYLTLYWQVDFASRKANIQPIPEEQIPRFRTALKNGWHLMLPIGVIIFMLVSGFTAQYSALLAIALSIPLSFVRKESRLSLKRALEACVNTGKTMTIIATATGSAGIVIAAMTYSGFEFKISNFLIAAAGDSLFLLVLFTGLLAFILGMGLPVLPAYIIVSLIASPLLVQGGLDIVTAHLFVFYFAMMSLYTPPVAPSSFVAAGIAGSGPFRVGWESVKLGIGAMIVPFLFVFHPTLVTLSPVPRLIAELMPIVAGLYVVASGIVGHLHTRLSLLERLGLLALGMGAMFAPAVYMQWICSAGAAAVCFFNHKKTQTAPNGGVVGVKLR